MRPVRLPGTAGLAACSSGSAHSRKAAPTSHRAALGRAVGRIWARGRELNPGHAIGTRERTPKASGAGPEFRRARSGTRRRRPNPTEAGPERAGGDRGQPKAQRTGDAVGEHRRKAWRHERNPKLDGDSALEPNGVAAERSGTRNHTRSGPQTGRAAKPRMAGNAGEAVLAKSRTVRAETGAGPRNQARWRAETRTGKETEHGGGRRREPGKKPSTVPGGDASPERNRARCRAEMRGGAAEPGMVLGGAGRWGAK
jgi:hypothetical protein